MAAAAMLNFAESRKAHWKWSGMTLFTCITNLVEVSVTNTEMWAYLFPKMVVSTILDLKNGVQHLVTLVVAILMLSDATVSMYMLHLRTKLCWNILKHSSDSKLSIFMVDILLTCWNVHGKHWTTHEVWSSNLMETTICYSEIIAAWIFLQFGLKMPVHTFFWGVGDLIV